MAEILLPAERVNVAAEADICVIGGSCTGVFAAVRAARLGAKVILLERQNRFGGVATLGLVGMWHTLFDITEKKQIIAGLTFEMLERMEKMQAASPFRQAAPRGIRINTEILTLELDRLIQEHPNIRVFLNCAFSTAITKPDGSIEAIVAENKSARFAVRAKIFIDASGDGVLCKKAGVAMRRVKSPQTPSSCARFSGWNFPPGFDLRACMEKYRPELPDLPCGYYWGMNIPDSALHMLAGTRVFNCDCDDADQITAAELEARRQIYAVLMMLKKELPNLPIALETLPAAIGIREGLHMQALRQLKGAEMLSGKDFPDAIANGTYPSDVHSDQDDGISFKFMNGNQTLFKNGKSTPGERWLPEGQVLPYYQIHLRCHIPANVPNLLAAGRMLDADREAFGAVRVMVNLNQCGEAVGVAAFQALQQNAPVQNLDYAQIRKLLAKGGSIVLPAQKPCAP
jgi:ribulose 1,5-bisphosphate synthetase/thiazole synthase